MADGQGLDYLREQYEDFLRRESVDDALQLAIDDSKQQNVSPRWHLHPTELRKFNPDLWQRMRRDPFRHLRALQLALHQHADELSTGYDKKNGQVQVGVVGPLGAAPLSPRNLTSAALRQLVSVEGVATKVSTIKPKLVKSVHYCPETNKLLTRQYVDATDPNLGLPRIDEHGQELNDRIVNITSTVYPTKDEEGHLLETEYGFCDYKDHQTVTLQEMPEKAPMGQLPRSVELIFEQDLVDRVKPGDRILVTGVYRALATAAIQSQRTTSGMFRTVLLVNNVQILGRNLQQLQFGPSDIRNIQSLSKRPDILDLLGRSLAPSIYGHDIIKKALALQLLSGVEKNLENGTHLRGDINILMVGDPSTAKSQLLRSCMTLAPLAISTTGKGSSGVGLTAAVTSDPETRERRLEAGAMVLADRGLVCVDEFDKMGENDRVAIHEAMEQQTITIAKAGIHASLNARCAVLAAANPVYGQYDRRRRMAENIGLPDSLLSRFDLLFVVLDQMDPNIDRNIAHHVVRGHQYRSNQDNRRLGVYGAETKDDGELYDDEDESSDDEDAPEPSIWQNLYQGNNEDILQHSFVRKFLHFAKRLQPILTEEARETIATGYAELRSRQDERTLPITARSLETIIRLSTAHAKARLSAEVEAIPDVQVALSILRFALYHEGQQRISDSSDEGASPTHVSEFEAEGSANIDLTSPATKKLKTDWLQYIWKTLTDNDRQYAVQDFEGDADGIREALEQMVEKGRVHIDEGIVYQID